jgi:hypothetical protein
LKSVLRILTAALALAACAPDIVGPSPTDAPSVETTTTLPGVTLTTISASEGATRFRECLGERGVAIEPIPLDAQGRPRLDMVMRGLDPMEAGNVEALDACAVHLISGALDLTGSPLISAGVRALLEEFSSCVRSRGVPDFPLLIGGFNGIGSPFPVEEIPYDDPDLGDAVARCREGLTAG